MTGEIGGRRSAAGRTFRKELAEIRTQLAEQPASFGAWRVLLGQLGDRISAIGVLVRQIEEDTAERGAQAAAADAGQWLDRAGAAIAQRLADLNQLAPWAAALDRSTAGISGPGPAPTLSGLVAWCTQASAALEGRPAALELRAAIDRSRAHAEDLIDRAIRLAELADDFVEETEFGFLFSTEQQLFSIGFSVPDGRLDSSYYDTLASEARLASFVAIATGQIPHEHWFKLGRSLTPTGNARALLSWSASMFEYLMPLLVMRAYPGHAPRRDLPRRRGTADPVRPAAGRALGHLRIGVQRTGPRPELSVPRVRRAGARVEARPRRRPRRRPIRDAARRPARAARRAPQPGAARRGGPGRPLRILRGDRLHRRSGSRKDRGASCCRPTWRTTRA